jgi:glutamyl/glutaminyl-tRNA synthetase
MVRVRFAPSPTGSLHLGGALTAVANRDFADEHHGVLVLRIDDTDASRTEEGSEAGILRDLDWLGVPFEEGPVRQSERSDLYRAAADRLVGSRAAYDDEGAVRFPGEHDPTLLRADGGPTYHLASVVDDIDLGITHVIRGKDHLPNEALHRALAEALGAKAPNYLHHGLILSPEGGKLSKRSEGATVADLREEGIPAAAVRGYLRELGLPRSDVRLDLGRLRRLAVEAIAAMSDEELAAAAEAPLTLVPALRGSRTLVEARQTARSLERAPESTGATEDERPTLERFLELRGGSPEEVDPAQAKAILRELKAVGGDLRTLRRVLTGAERGPELWAVLAALSRDEALSRVTAAL